MKLIDLLVQELPKRGGWPDGADCCCLSGADSDGVTMQFRFIPRGNDFLFTPDADHLDIPYKGDASKVIPCGVITKEAYQSVLDASQKPAWNGEGLPPVGAKVEFFINPKFGYRNDWIPDVGTEMEVVAHKTTTDGNDVAVCYWDEGGAGRSCCLVPESLKPLRTESERKRDAAIEAMNGMWNINSKMHCESIYDAIAAGQIPGVKLED